MKQTLETQFWVLVKEWQKLGKQRMQAIKVWNVPEITRLESLLEDNKQKSNEIIDKLKSLV